MNDHEMMAMVLTAEKQMLDPDAQPVEVATMSDGSPGFVLCRFGKSRVITDFKAAMTLIRQAANAGPAAAERPLFDGIAP